MVQKTAVNMPMLGSVWTLKRKTLQPVSPASRLDSKWVLIPPAAVLEVTADFSQEQGPTSALGPPEE